jgi:type IV pilus biogenesis protein PilP
MRMIKTVPLFVVVALCAVAHAAPVAPASAPADASASQLASLQAQIPIWQARARIARLKAEIQHAEKGPSGQQRGSYAERPQSGSPAVSKPTSVFAQSGSIMHLETVAAYNGHYVALLDVDGAGIQVHQGDEVADGWRVARITDNAVELVRGRQSRMLRL